MTAKALSTCVILYAPYYKSPKRVSDAVIVSDVLSRLCGDDAWKAIMDKYGERFKDNRCKAVASILVDRFFDLLVEVKPDYKTVYAKALCGILLRPQDKDAIRSVEMIPSEHDRLYLEGNIRLVPFKEHPADSRFGGPWMECILTQPATSSWNDIGNTGFASVSSYADFLKVIRKDTKHKFIRGRYESLRKLREDFLQVPEATGLMLEFRIWNSVRNRKDFNSRRRFRVYGTELDPFFSWKQSALDLFGSDKFMDKMEEALNAHASVIEAVNQLEPEVKSAYEEEHQ